MQLVVLFVIAYSAVAMTEPAVTGFFVAPIYKIEEKVGVLENRLSEVEDIERRVLNKLDQASVDGKKAVRDQGRAQIGEVQVWLKKKVTMLTSEKKTILDAMKKMMAVLPVEQRLAMLRRLKIEHRFSSVKEMIQDAHQDTGFTEKQLDEFHKQQTHRANIEKKMSVAREKLALAQVEKKKAQERAEKAEKLAKEKAKQKKAIKELKEEIKQTKKTEKKTNAVMNKSINFAKKQAKKQAKKVEQLKEKVIALEKKDKTTPQEKKKLAVTKAKLAKTEQKQKKVVEGLVKKVEEKYDNKIKVLQENADKIKAQLNTVKGTSKADLKRQLTNTQADIQTEKLKLKKRTAEVKEKNAIKA
uniref:Tropomyosin-1 alpha chain, putative n=1 Tax=Entamoeba invadens TaxID=33085 RepID=S0B4U8_ENTIV|nr:tropomyosin-1 alpha chain, putative [Entamoeba invadens]